MIGDILFYRAKIDSLPDTVVKFYEIMHGAHNPFVHVAIEFNNTPASITPQKVEALWNGVVLSPLNNAAIDARYSLPKNLNPVAVMAAFNWLDGQIFQAYGYGDLLDAVLQHPVLEEHYDCSSLAANFLRLCGDPHVHKDENPHYITPATLANMLGVQ